MASIVPCFLSSNHKKDSDAGEANARLKDLEAQLSAKNARLATSLSEKTVLEATVGDLQEQIDKVRTILVSVHINIMFHLFLFCSEELILTL